MKIVYFADKSISFANQANEPNNLVINATNDTPPTLTKVLELFKSYDHIVVISHNIEACFLQFTKEFKGVTAAGGVVINPQNELLMINRFKRWDLPKGHHEEGESLEECAMREVEEETKITQLTLGDKVGTTLHTYIKKGVWELKTTHWWRMTTPQLTSPTPQREEGITAAKWIPLNKVKELTTTSFQTIKEVLRVCF